MPFCVAPLRLEGLPKGDRGGAGHEAVSSDARLSPQKAGRRCLALLKTPGHCAVRLPTPESRANFCRRVGKMELFGRLLEDGSWVLFIVTWRVCRALKRGRIRGSCNSGSNEFSSGEREFDAGTILARIRLFRLEPESPGPVCPPVRLPVPAQPGLDGEGGGGLDEEALGRLPVQWWHVRHHRLGREADCQTDASTAKLHPVFIHSWSVPPPTPAAAPDRGRQTYGSLQTGTGRPAAGLCRGYR